MTALQTAHQPKMLGRYELMYLLGQGGMGEVHLARLTGAAGFEKLCIVKTILPQMMTDPQFVDRFHHEAKVLVQLNHSNIAQVYDMGDVDETLYMAIEYVPGVDLGRVEDRARSLEAQFPLAVALHIGQQMCEALGYAHRKVGGDGLPLGIVHRDVSPQNVMVSYEGEVKVIDFGLAKSTARSKHTMPSTVLGKLGYMSPEQARAETVDHRSDIYSAGIVLWELLAGRPLFNGGTVGEMVAMMANPRPQPLREVRPDVSEAVEKIVMRSLAADPNNRYSRADDMARALNEQLVREGMSVGAEDVGNYVRAMCPEEFAAERQLQSRLSLTRKKSGSGSAPQNKPASKPEIEGTLMRAPATNSGAKALSGTKLRTPAPAAPMTAAQKAMSQVMQQPEVDEAVDEPSEAPQAPIAPPRRPSQVSRKSQTDAFPDEPLAVQKSKGPLVVVLLLALVVVGGGGFFAYQRFVLKPDGGDLVVEMPPEKKADPSLTAEDVKPVKAKDKEPVKVDPPPQQQKDTEPAKVVVPVKPLEREKIEVGKQQPVYRVLKDGEQWYAQMPNGKPKLKEGDEVKLVGPAPDKGNLREVYVTASVVESRGALGRLLLDDPSGVPDKVWAVKEGRRGGVGRRDEMVNAPVGEKGERIDRADRPAPMTDKLVVDPATTNTAAEVVPAKGTDEVKAEPQKPKVKQLYGALTRSGGVFSRVTLENKSDVNWHGCEVRLPDNTVFRYGENDEIKRNEGDGIRTNKFTNDQRAPDPQFANGWALVRCKEGVGYMPYKVE